MSKKKSYMNQSNIINEGFFNKLTSFLKNRPKIRGKKKLGILKSLKIALNTAGLNRSIDNYERLIKKQLGDDYPDLPRFTPEDFLK